MKFAPLVLKLVAVLGLVLFASPLSPVASADNTLPEDVVKSIQLTKSYLSAVRKKAGLSASFGQYAEQIPMSRVQKVWTGRGGARGYFFTDSDDALLQFSLKLVPTSGAIPVFFDVSRGKSANVESKSRAMAKAFHQDLHDLIDYAITHPPADARFRLDIEWLGKVLYSKWWPKLAPGSLEDRGVAFVSDYPNDIFYHLHRVIEGIATEK